MGRVQQLKREEKGLPPHAAVDAEGNETTDPNQAVSLLPFGAHKGYGLGLLNEIMGAMSGGSLPTVRGIPKDIPEEKFSCNFSSGHPPRSPAPAILPETATKGPT